MMYTGIGLMSGSSLDGLDIVHCQFSQDNNEQWSWQILDAETISFDDRWKRRLAKVINQPAEALARTDVFFGHWLGKTTQDFIQRYSIKPQFVASHGQTIFHQPENGFTYQIGDGESLVSYLDCPAVTNFRNKNLALGGQGAPLVPFGEKHLFSQYQYCLNLGGIANLSHGSRAFDVSPCNMVLNQLASAIDANADYDPDGEFARSGTVDQELLHELNTLPYYASKPPKSLGAEWVQHAFFPILKKYSINTYDMLCTVAEHIAFQIGEVIRRMGATPGTMLITGGGYFNTYLRERICDICSNFGVKVDETVSSSTVEYKEALIFAFLGLMVLLGKPNITAHSTGVTSPILGGAIHLPSKGYAAIL